MGLSVTKNTKMKRGKILIILLHIFLYSNSQIMEDNDYYKIRYKPAEIVRIKGDTIIAKNFCMDCDITDVDTNINGVWMVYYYKDTTLLTSVVTIRNHKKNGFCFSKSSSYDYCFNFIDNKVEGAVFAYKHNTTNLELFYNIKNGKLYKNQYFKYGKDGRLISVYKSKALNNQLKAINKAQKRKERAKKNK